MFDFFKKSFIGAGMLQGFTDVHCHILPGVDDGVQTMKSALRTLNFYEQNGVKRVFFTPHVAEELHENSANHLRERFEELQNTYQGKLQLGLGAEYMLDRGFDALLDRKEKFLCASGHLILVETTAMQAPIDFKQILFDLQERGYDVMLAHPERYLYMSHSDYGELRLHKIRLQMNLLSIAGVYGHHAKENAEWLLGHDMYTYMGSDLHNVDFHGHKMNEKKFTSSQIHKMKKLIANNNGLKL
jgi:protein-tyrosine phosphatase